MTIYVLGEDINTLLHEANQRYGMYYRGGV